MRRRQKEMEDNTMQFKRMLIEQESPEEYGYDKIKYNLTESSTTDKTMRDVGIKLPDDLLLCYGDHLGKLTLRELIAASYGVSADEVLITVGSCMALFTVYSALLMPGDHVVIMHPNYPANVEIPKSLGCAVDLLELQFEEGFRLDVDRLLDMIRPETKLVSITYPHNPTGTMLAAADLQKLLRHCEKMGCFLMVDETYGDLTVGPRLPHVAALSQYGICVESLSKAIGVPGIRTGWVATQNKELLRKMIAAKEQICICGSVVDEECAYQVLAKREELMAVIRQDIKEKLAVVCEIMENQDCLEWVKPQGGVVCFPRIKAEIEIDTAEFYDVLNNQYGVFVGPGRWFDMDDRSFRVGYAWPDKEQLREGLLKLIEAVQQTRKN